MIGALLLASNLVANAVANDGVTQAQEVATATQQRSVLDGIYDAAQANRGRQAYAEECSVCHGAQLGGGGGPALAGPAFMQMWEGRSVWELFSFTRSAMPQGFPQSLPDETYLAIIAHILRGNGLPEGDVAMPIDQEFLAQIPIEPPQ